MNPRISFSRTRVALALAALCAPGTHGLAWAQTELRNVVVTATRHEAEADDVPATVTSTTRQQLDRRLPGNTADLFANEPDMAVSRDARRFGATRPNIRGLEDNRVVQQVDGVRLTDYYNGGGPTNFTLSAPLGVVPDFLKRVEVVRGASSSLYGSDAIGGVIGFLTLDPTDLLGADKARAARVRASYLGANNERRLTALGAFRGDESAWRPEFLLGASSARAHETKTMGSVDTTSTSRTRANPQSIDDQGVLAKLVLHPAAGHKLTASVEGRDMTVDTNVLRLSSSLPKVTATQGEDQSKRLRGSLEWEHKMQDGPYDRLHAMVYRQNADTENHNLQRRSSTSASCSATASGVNSCNVDQYFSFSQDTTGANVQLDKWLKTDGGTHMITGGVDVSRQKVVEYRDATIYNLTSGTVGKTLAGDSFPLRDFANGRTNTIGLFAQDEIGGLAGGALSLTPGLRYDHRTLKPEVDALARSVLTAIGRDAVEKSDGAWSPKLGAMWRFSPAVAAYGQVARSYRAPNYNEVNGAFRNTVQSYGTSPNADLKPETGIGGELGIKLTSGEWRAQVAVFDNHYKDFIESVYLSCPGDPRCISGLSRTSMAVNLDKVRIHGTEVRGGWAFAPGWHLDGSLARTVGTNQETDQPLNSVEPTRLGLILTREADGWGAEARLRAAARKSRIDDSVDGTYFRTPGYGAVDLSGWATLSRNLRVTAAVNNLFDHKYWLWSDIRKADAANPVGVDFYSQPGRTFSVALQADF